MVVLEGGTAPETGFATIAISPGDLLHEDTEERKQECKAEETNTEPIHTPSLIKHTGLAHTDTDTARARLLTPTPLLSLPQRETLWNTGSPHSTSTFPKFRINSFRQEHQLAHTHTYLKVVSSKPFSSMIHAVSNLEKCQRAQRLS